MERKSTLFLLWMCIFLEVMFILIGVLEGFGFFLWFSIITVGLLFSVMAFVAIRNRCPQCKKLDAMYKVGTEEIHSVSEVYSTERVQEKVGTMSTHVGFDTYRTDIYADKDVEHLDKVIDGTYRYKCACCGYVTTRRVIETRRSY